MGQRSSQVLAEPFGANTDAAQVPLTIISPTASFPSQVREPELERESSKETNDRAARKSQQPQVQLLDRKRRSSCLADFDQGGIFSTSQPRHMAKSRPKAGQKSQRQNSSSSARHVSHRISKAEFLSTLTQDARPASSSKPELKAAKHNTVSTPTMSKRKRDHEDETLHELTNSNKRLQTYSKKGARRSASKVLARRSATPESSDVDQELVSSPNSLIVKSSKRPATSKSSPKTTSISAVTTPATKSMAAQVTKSRDEARPGTMSEASQLHFPKQASAPELRLPTASNTQQVFSSNPDTNPSDTAGDARRAAIAENYKKSIGKVERARAELSTEEVIANGGGPFTQQELAKANELKADFCSEKDISEKAFDALLHVSTRSDSNAAEAWSRIYEAYPYRKRHALQKIFRRQFHPYSRTVGWTKEEDQQLRDLVQALGKKWKDIGSRIDRRPEDARDRWRNYLQYDNQKKEKWDAGEVLALGMAVGDLMYKVLCDKREEAREQGTEAPAGLSNDDCRKLIEWHTVCQKVPGRSRLQCLQKWGDLERLDMTSFENEVREAARRASSNPDPAPVMKVKLLEGDQLRLCRAIAKSRARTVSDISWKDIRSQKLEIFSKKLLRKAWKQLYLDHLGEPERSESKVSIAASAVLVRQRLKKATPKVKRKSYWSKNGQDDPSLPEPPTLRQHYPALLKRQQEAALRKQEKGEKEVGVGARTFKSSEVVSESDDENFN